MEYLKQKNKTIQILNNINLLILNFDFNDKNIQNKFKDVLEKLKNPTLNKLLNINSDLKELELNILNSNINSNALSILNKMYEKLEFIQFIFTKNTKDIRNIQEFIDDSEDCYLTISDINQLENCVTFIKDLIKNKNTEKEILDRFIEIIEEEKYKNIGIMFENSSSKYYDFNELFIGHLNPSEINKEHINNICNKSDFRLKAENPKYKCIVKYKNNGKLIIKNFDEILDLRNIALLRKKAQKDEKYFKICDDFSKNINDIQEIL